MSLRASVCSLYSVTVCRDAEPTRVTVRETVEAVPDAVLGYTELGLGPDDGALLDQGEGRINSARKFWPNESYEPQVSAHACCDS